MGWEETLPQKSRFSGTPKTKLDLLPEYCHYRDEGCELAASCLNCPFPECVYTRPGGRQRWLKGLRDKEVLRLFTNQGKGVRELATVFGVSRRTIQRILKRARNKSTPKIKILGGHDE
jgi:hypothetical protein